MNVRGGNTGRAVLLNLGTGWGGWSVPLPLYTWGKDPVSIPQEAVWALGPVWTGAENLPLPHQDLILGLSSPYQVTDYNDYAIPAPLCIGKRNKHKLVTSGNVIYTFILSSVHSAGGWRVFHLDRTNLFVNDTYTATMDPS